MRVERSRSAQALAEWAVVLPAALLLTLGIIQFALVLIGKTVVNHAAFAATRAQLVGEDPVDAATIVCAPIAGTRYETSRVWTHVKVPGWGDLPRSDYSRDKIVVDSTSERESATGNSVTVQIRHDFELVIPVVDLFFRSRRPGTSVFTSGVYTRVDHDSGQGDRVRSRAEVAKGAYLRFTEKCTLPRPWTKDADLGLAP